jgi:competence protein ComEC
MRKGARTRAIALAAQGGTARAAFALKLRLDLSAWAAGQIDQRRLFLLVPVAIGLGIILYFLADGEPSPLAPVIGSLVLAGAVHGLRRHVLARYLALGALLVMLGFGAAVLRTILADAPRIERTLVADIGGVALSVDPSQGSSRILVAVSHFSSLSAEQNPAVPKLIRVSTKQGMATMAGDSIRFRARLLPPAPPALPGGYDFQREAYFAGIGAVGSVLGKLEIVPGARAGGVTAAIDRGRNILTARIADTIGGQAGALSASLITGKRGLLTEETNAALRAAGIYHIVSISGLHMALVAGALFFLSRAVFALSPAFAMRWPIKKLAAMVSLTGTALYCLFSGAEVATVRSLIMTGVMLGAILFDRPALSMRNVAIAATIILLMEPETLLGPSFQMSFAAVLALIAAHEGWSRWRAARMPAAPPAANGLVLRALRRLGMFVLALAATTLVATAATAPFGIAHFQKINSYGLIGNLLAVPLVSFVVMPAALLGTLLYPFGLDRFVWLIMGEANSAVIAIAERIAGWDSASLSLPASRAGFLLMAAALIMATVPLGRARLVALVPAALGIALTATLHPPAILISADGTYVLMRDNGSGPALFGRQPGDFVLGQWLSQAALPVQAFTPETPLSVSEAARCDQTGCIAQTSHGQILAYVETAAAFEEDCKNADILITPLEAPAWCRPKGLLIDSRFLKQHGATSITEIGNSLSVASARSTSGRPWQ